MLVGGPRAWFPVVAVWLLCLIFRQLVAWLGLLACSSRSKNAEFVVLRPEVVVLCRQVNRSRLSWMDQVVFAAPAGLFSQACRLHWIVTSAVVLRWHRGLVRRHLHRRPSTRNRDFRYPPAGARRWVQYAAGVCHHGRRGCSGMSLATRSRSKTGAATVPGLTRTAVNCRRWTRHVQGILYFRRSADGVDNPGGQVGTYRQVKGSPSLLQAAAITLR